MPPFALWWPHKAPTFGGLLLAFFATCPTKNASRRIILDGRRDLTHPGIPHPKGNAEDVLNRRNSKYKNIYDRRAG